MQGNGIKLVKRGVCTLLGKRDIGIRQAEQGLGTPVGQGLWRPCRRKGACRAAKRGSLKAWKYTANFYVLPLRNQRKPGPSPGPERKKLLEGKGCSLTCLKVSPGSPAPQQWQRRPHGGAKALRAQQPGGAGSTEHQPQLLCVLILLRRGPRETEAHGSQVSGTAGD